MQIHTGEQHASFAAGFDVPRSQILLIPDVAEPDKLHWQRHWEALPNSRRVGLSHGTPATFHRWISAVDAAVRDATGPVTFAADGLGCLAVVWWAALARAQGRRLNIDSALLVAPPDVDSLDVPAGVRDFRPAPRSRLPFKSIIVAGPEDDRARLQSLAAAWGSGIADAIPAGSVDPRWRLGEWSSGLRLLAWLVGDNPDRLVAELSVRIALS